MDIHTFYGDVNIVQLKFADNDITKLELNGETLLDVVSKQDVTWVDEGVAVQKGDSLSKRLTLKREHRLLKVALIGSLGLSYAAESSIVSY